MKEAELAREESLRKRYALTPEFIGQVYDSERIFTYLKGFFEGAGMLKAQRALGDMRKFHAGQVRVGGLPYEVHPMQMASHAIQYWRPGDKNLTDDFFAMLLLHDVVEDTGVSIREMGYGDVVVRGIRLMTLTRFKNETKYELKKRYYNELPGEKNAALGKGFDKIDNLRTMITSFRDDPDRIRKNVVEADQLTAPMLKRAQEEWSEAGSLFQALQQGVRDATIMLAVMYGVRLTDENFINPQDAQDYLHLLTEAS